MFVLKKWFWISGIAIFLSIAFGLCLPDPLFSDECSTVLNASNGRLLGACIAPDQQWRFPYHADVPEKFEKAIIQFEDAWFYYHPGFNPISLFRALKTNIKARKVIRGGSTLSMQVIRLSRKGQKRNLWQKVVEIILATRAEIRYSKKEILALFVSNAPFGGNVVGIDAAAWRYFGRRPDQLSWAETATLAVLPNAPSLIHPGKNRELLLQRRNRLLEKLKRKYIIDDETCRLSKLEPLPDKPMAMPQFAPHLLTRIYNSNLRYKTVQTTLDYELQEKVSQIINHHSKQLRFNQIFNAAAVVLEVESGNALAYVGNTDAVPGEDHGNSVDVITAPRSTGSILKPVLYASLLDDGMILPGTLIPDIPVIIGGYSPKNFSNSYDGAVHAQKALSRSLNIPAVFMLREYGYPRFYDMLKKTGLATLDKPSSHYGLSLILGGAEALLWDLAGVYASMARTLNHFYSYSGRYDPKDFHEPSFLVSMDSSATPNFQKKGLLSAASIWLTFNALLEVNRPEEEMGWESFLSARKIAWKTGTSFGFRDGWAIGTNKQNVVAVWVGNADGEGRPGLTGVECAAPILFDIFELLKSDGWFQPPYDEMTCIPVCRLSGSRATEICSPVDSVWVQNTGLNTMPCHNHRLIHLDKSGKFQVNSDCYAVSSMKNEAWFVLPPVQEWYFKSKNPLYRTLPPVMAGCNQIAQDSPMQFIYPEDNAKIYIPVEMDQKRGNTIFEVAHRKPQSTLYWHLDGIFIGTTRDFHQMGFAPGAGKHSLVVVDEEGNSIIRKFEILEK